MVQHLITVIQFLIFLVIGPFFFLIGLIMEKRKFAIGTIEIANNIHFLSKVFPDSFTVNFITNVFYKQNTYDFGPYGRLSFLFKPLLFAYLIPRASIFFYVWSVGYFNQRTIDFKILKFFRKKIITLFCGDDIRSPSAYRRFANEKVGDCFVNYLISPGGYGSESYEREKLDVVKEAVKYSDLILNYPVDNMSAMGKVGIPFPYMIDDQTFVPQKGKYDDLRLLTVVHAPSSSAVKGTSLVRAAIKKLQYEGYVFNYIEIMNKPNAFVNDVLAKSHIVLNQFYAFAPGLFGIEAMLLENVVLMSADPEVETFPDGFSQSYVKTNYWEVYDKLRYCLDNPDKLAAIAARARAYVLANYAIESSARTYRKILNENGIVV
jgi:hypothetical protein